MISLADVEPALWCFCIGKYGPSSSSPQHGQVGSSLCFLRTRFVLTNPILALCFANHIFFQSGTDLHIRLNTSQLNSSSLSFTQNCVFQCCCIVGSCSVVRICIRHLLQSQLLHIKVSTSALPLEAPEGLDDSFTILPSLIGRREHSPTPPHRVLRTSLRRPGAL